MFESEMFGYEAGAFTGAQKRRVGKLEAASGGTLFLDEIESMPLSLQVKLLRVLQDGVLERLGSNQPVQANLRVVAAAKGDMNEHVADGTFRRDLLYRLNVVTITLPPLNERREDIVPLFEHFLLDAAVRYERPAPLVTDRQRAELMQRDWPGNVRELRNTLERAVALAEPLAIESRPPASPAVDTSVPLRVGKQRLVDGYERAYVERLLSECNGNHSEAARRAGIDRISLYRLLDRHGLRGS
jgi:two-component system, NtrC family, C4-dicarboxylate transport response regulator DctD